MERLRVSRDLDWSQPCRSGNNIWLKSARNLIVLFIEQEDQSRSLRIRSHRCLEHMQGLHYAYRRKQ